MPGEDHGNQAMSRLCLGCPCESLESVSKDRAGGQAQWLSTGCHGRGRSTPPASDPLGWGLAIPCTPHWKSCPEALSRCERQEAGPRLHLQRLVSSKCLAGWRRTPETQRKMKGLLCWHKGPPCSSEAETSVPQAVARSPLPLGADGWGSGTLSDSPSFTRGSRSMWLGLPPGPLDSSGLGMKQIRFGFTG